MISRDRNKRLHLGRARGKNKKVLSLFLSEVDPLLLGKEMKMQRKGINFHVTKISVSV